MWWSPVGWWQVNLCRWPDGHYEIYEFLTNDSLTLLIYFQSKPIPMSTNCCGEPALIRNNRSLICKSTREMGQMDPKKMAWVAMMAISRELSSYYRLIWGCQCSFLAGVILMLYYWLLVIYSPTKWNWLRGWWNTYCWTTIFFWTVFLELTISVLVDSRYFELKVIQFLPV